VNEGLVKTLLPPNERDTERARTRATGVIFHKHLEATFLGQTDTKRYKFRLEGGNRRWVEGKTPHVRYVFTVLNEESLPEDGGSDEAAMIPKVENRLSEFPGGDRNRSSSTRNQEKGI
jgi:hypothetical protein